MKKLKPTKPTQAKSKAKNKTRKPRHQFGVWKIPENAVITYGRSDPSCGLQADGDYY